MKSPQELSSRNSSGQDKAGAIINSVIVGTLTAKQAAHAIATLLQEAEVRGRLSERQLVKQEIALEAEKQPSEWISQYRMTMHNDYRIKELTQGEGTDDNK